MRRVMIGRVMRIAIVSRHGATGAPLATASLRSHLEALGIEGVEVLPAGLEGPYQLSAEAREGLAYLGLEAEALEPLPLTPDHLEQVELVLCLEQADLDQVLEMGSGRAYTLSGYLGWPEGRVSGDPANLSDVMRQIADQISYELETDPARPGSTRRG